MRKSFAIFAVSTIFLLSACGIFKPTEKHRTPSIPEKLTPHATNPDARYAKQLVRCPFAKTVDQSCPLSELPFLAPLNEPLTRADIMNRLVISHPWMKERFSEVLANVPDDIIQMFGAVTAVVVASNIRPAFYHPRTGAIYLESDYICLSKKECDADKIRTGNGTKERTDYREKFIEKFKFETFWMWSGEHRPKNEEGRDNRAYYLSVLLLHELAHANDHLPPLLRAELQDTSKKPYDALERFEGRRISDGLQPLVSKRLKTLAQGFYNGEKIDLSVQNMTASEVAGEFKSDAATMFYSYSSQFEDLANTFTGFMMSQYFEVESLVTFHEKPMTKDYQIFWGQKNRIADPKILERAHFIFKNIFPKKDLSEYSKPMASPVEIEKGTPFYDAIKQ